MVRALILSASLGLVAFLCLYDPYSHEPHVIEKHYHPGQQVWIDKSSAYTTQATFTLELSDGRLLDVPVTEYSRYKKGQSYP